MKFAEATKFHRKSGGTRPEWKDVPQGIRALVAAVDNLLPMDIKWEPEG